MGWGKGDINCLPDVLGNDIHLQKSGWMKKGAPPSGYIYIYILQVDNYDWLQLLL